MPLFLWHIYSAPGISYCSSLLSWGACWDQLVEVPLIPSGELGHFTLREAQGNKGAGKKGRIPEWFPEVAKLLYPCCSLLCLVPSDTVTVRAQRTLRFRGIVGPSSVLIPENTVCALFSSFRHILTQNLPHGGKFIYPAATQNIMDNCICPIKAVLVSFLQAGAVCCSQGQSLCSAETPVLNLHRVFFPLSSPQNTKAGAPVTQGSCCVTRSTHRQIPTSP